MGAVLAFFNRKGGTAKTSCTFHLSGAWARQGKKILLLDMDPQQSLTQAFFGPEMAWQFQPEESLSSLFEEGIPNIEALPHATPHKGIFLAPGGAELGNHNYPRPTETGSLQMALRAFVDEMRPLFDQVLIDCPPCLQLMSWASIMAADGVVVPLIPEDPGAQGLIHVQQLVDSAIVSGNPRLKLVAYVLSMANSRLALHKAYEKILRESEGELVAKTVIPMAVPFKEAIASLAPLPILKPKIAGSKIMAALAQELEENLAAAQAAPPRFYYLQNQLNHQAAA